MISFCVNGKRESRSACSVLELLAKKQLAPERVVVELNGAIVKRPQWGETMLREGDTVEIVCFVGGG
ncbi:MAG: Sulfur carrier protein ThiS [Betaproteobacteria bacterium ADurb.Bin341]|nr:MAG: Sulfur carrier protein ThiS [Betaproteobacteria bacterium ADurb.Bin341]